MRAHTLTPGRTGSNLCPNACRAHSCHTCLPCLDMATAYAHTCSPRAMILRCSDDTHRLSILMQRPACRCLQQAAARGRPWTDAATPLTSLAPSIPTDPLGNSLGPTLRIYFVARGPSDAAATAWSHGALLVVRMLSGRPQAPVAGRGHCVARFEAISEDAGDNVMEAK